MYEILEHSAFQNNHITDIIPTSGNSLLHNGRVKIYPDGSVEFLGADRAIFREAGFESVDYEEQEEAGKHEAKDKLASLERSKRRARTMVSDYIRANDLDLFCTFTVDPKKCDRYDTAEVFRKLHNWLDNNVRRHGLKYVLVPEYHKDGAVHFHACMNRALTLVDSGTIDRHDGGKPRRPHSKTERMKWLAQGGSVVYNVSNWSLGFSTAIEMYGDRAAAINYVCKYISKSDDKIGGRWYYSGGDLRLPVSYTCDVPFELMEKAVNNYHGGSWVIAALDCRCAKCFLKGDELDGFFATLERC